MLRYLRFQAKAAIFEKPDGRLLSAIPSTYNFRFKNENSENDTPLLKSWSQFRLLFRRPYKQLPCSLLDGIIRKLSVKEPYDNVARAK